MICLNQDFQDYEFGALCQYLEVDVQCASKTVCMVNLGNPQIQ